MTKSILGMNRRHPSIVGIGLVSLDVVTSAEMPTEYFAGGTCGNVLAILAHLGWQSHAMSRLAHDRASAIVCSDLEHWGVDVSLLRIAPVAKTPIIVERLRKDINGIPYHNFSFYCPSCNRRYPGFQPVPIKSLDLVLSRVPKADVLFIDRVSPSAVALAKRAQEQGTIVFFEPSSANHDNNLRLLLEAATIVKYSHDRIDELDVTKSTVKLEIQTLGRGGLRFRTILGNLRNRWHHLDAEPKADLVDSAGAGDWLSAGLIYSLCAGGSPHFSKLKYEELLCGFYLGQSLAAWNCGFVGARGGMYGEKLRELTDLLRSHTVKLHTRMRSNATEAQTSELAQLCEGCHVLSDKERLKASTAG